MKTLLCLSVSGLCLWAQYSFQPQLPNWESRPILKPQVSSPQARTQSLGWLLPNQDYAIVPDPTNDPNYADDTLLSNGTGPNTRTNPPAACVGTFFDSLESVGAYLLIGNERFKIGTVSQPMGLCAYLDGAIAERYDIAPDLGATDRTVSIKGVAVWIVNFGSGNSCAPTLGTPTPDDGDNAYTLTYAIHPARTVSWGSPFYASPRSGTAPAATAIRSVKKPISAVRIGNSPLGDSGPQCPTIQGNPPSLTEVFDFAYFTTPLDITDSTSYYVAVSTERYNVNTYSLSDTLYFLYGPANSGFNPATHPCYNADTTLIGRSLVSWAIYDTVNGTFYSTPSALVGAWQDWIPLHAILNPPLNRGLNWVAFPIVYAQNITTGAWIRGELQDVMTPYPNPATDCVHLRLSSQQPSRLQVSLYTLNGELVKTWEPREVPAGEAQLTLDVGEFPAGSYLLRVQSELARAAFHLTILR